MPGILRQSLRLSAVVAAAMMLGGFQYGNPDWPANYSVTSTDCSACGGAGETEAYAAANTGMFQATETGITRERSKDEVADQRETRREQNGNRDANGPSPQVVAPALRELPFPTRAPQAIRPAIW